MYFLSEIYSEGKQGLGMKKKRPDGTSCVILFATPFLK